MPKERRSNRDGIHMQSWETDFYTPPVLGGAALLPFSAPAVYKKSGSFCGPKGTGFLYTAGAENGKRAAPPSTGGV